MFFTAFPVNHSLAENTIHFYENFVKSISGKKEENSPILQRNQSFRPSTPNPNTLDDSDDESIQVSTIGSINSSYSNTFTDKGNDTIVIPEDHQLSLSLYDGDNSILASPGLLTVIVQQATDVPYSGVIKKKIVLL